MSGFSYLRSMHESDLDWVMGVEQQAYDYPWSKKGFENSLDQGLNYIFCSGEGEQLGYACMLTVLDEVQLLNFCVAPKFQKQGVGRAAMNALKEKLNAGGYRLILLEVRASNEAGQKLYKQCEFQHDGVRKNYYRCQLWDDESLSLIEGKEDAVLMSCTL